MKNGKKLCAIVLLTIICVMLVGCGKSNSSERTKSGELMLNSVENSGETKYISHSVELEEKPIIISQIIPLEDGFLLLGEQKEQQCLTEICFNCGSSSPETSSTKVSSFLKWLKTMIFLYNI